MSATTPPPSTRIELPYLDGLRGLAALVVAVYHAYLFTGYRGDAYAQLSGIGWVLGYGYLAVPVFIVLSGYVLMLPVVRRPDLSLPHGFRSYIARRARRILPPYYVALALSLALIAAVPVMQQRSGTQWDSKVPVTDGAVVSHLLLLHDLRPDWIGTINGPLWSIAVEWHIYFLMPLVLLPLWRRLPPAVVVALVLAVTVLPTALGSSRFAYAHPWLVGLFACGMLAAQATVRREWRLTWLRPATWVTGVAAVVAMLGAWDWWHPRAWATETLAGVVFAAGLVLLGRRALDGGTCRTIAALQARPMMLLGLASYSIYLVHSPLLGLANLLMLPWGLPIWGQFLMMILVAVPLALAVCALFYRLVERRFQNTRQKHASSELAAQDQPGHRPEPPAIVPGGTGAGAGPRRDA